ncbi:MAG TPA: AmmeMemoRadiSam system protein B [Candidatus Methylomirabilis sp.]|nr:AmmeMemoRadiSam system protein B [Candidatus Methylomirabilis sp.]
MLVFAAVVPHSPLLAASVGKEKRDTLQATLNAYGELEQALYLAKVETIVVISPHAASYPDAFSANMAPKYVGTLKAFGDHQTTIEAKGDFLLLDRLQRELRSEGVPFTLTSSEDLDYGFTIPLLFLTQHLKDWRLVPLAPSLLDTQAHVNFGTKLKNVLHRESTRVAFIASADLSHKLNETSPGGASVEGPAFDATIRSKLASMDIKGLLALDAQAVEAAGQCGYRPIATLMGVLDGMNVTAKELAYEAPFGVGYLTMRFDLA